MQRHDEVEIPLNHLEQLHLQPVEQVLEALPGLTPVPMLLELILRFETS